MKINKDLLAIKGHFFLRCAGTASLILMLPLIVRSKGLSVQAVGALYTLLPVVGLVIGSISGTVADYFKAHRIVFLGSLTCLTTGIVSLHWIPELPLPAQALTGADSLASSENATLGLRALIDGNSSSLCVHLACVDPDMVVGEGQLPPIDLLNIEEVEVESHSMWMLFQYPQFWLIVVAVLTEQIGLAICIPMADAVCFQILGSERHKYGQQRLWGTVGMGIMAVASGALVDLYSQGLPQKDYLPAFVICFLFMVMDMVVVSRIRIPYADDHKLVIGDVSRKLLNPQVFLFLVSVFVMGISLGIVWVFKLMMMEDVSLVWDSEFPALKLLQGLVLGIETFLGEIPFFFLSGAIITRLGYMTALKSSLVAMGLRCCLYYTVTNPWWFLPIELLNGPSYSLFHSVMASYSSYIAPPGAQATLQSIFRTAFYAGYSISGILGGLLYKEVGGSLTFLYVGMLDIAYVFLFGILYLLVSRYCISDGVDGESRCMEVQCEEKMEPFAEMTAYVEKKLLQEKDCDKTIEDVARPYEETDECVKFIV